jgi:hypothetical protein
MNNIIKAVILCTTFVTGLAMADEERGKFVKLDTEQPDESLLITPLSCKFFVKQAVDITNMYLDGVSETERMRAISKEIAADIGNDDKYAGNALSVRFNYNIVKALADETVKKDIGYGYTYPESVKRQMTKMCANMVGSNTTSVKRIFEKKS